MLRQYSHRVACISGRACGRPAGILAECKAQLCGSYRPSCSRQQLGVARKGPVCRAASDALTLERPREAQQPRTRHQGDSRLASHQADALKHNQDLLHWLDHLTEDMADEGGHVLEEELQRAVETALRVQAQSIPPAGEAHSVPSMPRRPGRQHRQHRRHS